jgi:hypothetical protein
MIKTIITISVSILIIFTIFEIIRSYISSLFDDQKLIVNEIKDYGIYDYSNKDNQIWFETTETITIPIITRRNYYAENQQIIRRYKYKNKYNKLWKKL